MITFEDIQFFRHVDSINSLTTYPKDPKINIRAIVWANFFFFGMILTYIFVLKIPAYLKRINKSNSCNYFIYIDAFETYQYTSDGSIYSYTYIDKSKKSYLAQVVSQDTIINQISDYDQTSIPQIKSDLISAIYGKFYYLF